MKDKREVHVVALKQKDTFIICAIIRYPDGFKLQNHPEWQQPFPLSEWDKCMAEFRAEGLKIYRDENRPGLYILSEHGYSRSREAIQWLIDWALDEV